MTPGTKRILKRIYLLSLPDWAILQRLYRAMYAGYWLFWMGWQWLWKLIWVEPIYRAVCQRVGRRLNVEQTPFFVGKCHIEIGEDVTISGKLHVSANPKLGLNPTLLIGDHTFIGHATGFNIGKKITVGRHCNISWNTQFLDNDGHPVDAEARRNNQPVNPQDVGEITIGDDVWIGRNCVILRGVTVGDRTIISAGSILSRSVPADCVVAGNPARVILNLKPSPAGLPASTTNPSQP